MATSWTTGGQWREQQDVPLNKVRGSHLLHCEPLENFNREGDITWLAYLKDRSDHNLEGLKAGWPNRRRWRQEPGGDIGIPGGQGQGCRTETAMVQPWPWWHCPRTLRASREALSFWSLRTCVSEEAFNFIYLTFHTRKLTLLILFLQSHIWLYLRFLI